MRTHAVLATSGADRAAHPSSLETMHPQISWRKLVCERSGTAVSKTLIHSLG